MQRNNDERPPAADGGTDIELNGAASVSILAATVRHVQHTRPVLRPKCIQGGTKMAPLFFYALTL